MKLEQASCGSNGLNHLNEEFFSENEFYHKLAHWLYIQQERDPD